MTLSLFSGCTDLGVLTESQPDVRAGQLLIRPSLLPARTPWKKGKDLLKNR